VSKNLRKATDIFEKMLYATGFVETDALDQIRQQHPHLTHKELQERLLEKSLISAEQYAAFQSLSDNPDTQKSLSDPLMAKLGFLKKLAAEGKINEAYELYQSLNKSPVYTRIAALILKRACLKDPGQGPLLRLIEKSMETSKRKATRIKAMDGKGDQSGEGFQVFVKLKGAVATGNLMLCMELYAQLKADQTYGRAAFKLLQKIYLNKALSEHRKSDMEKSVIKCPGCQTAYALDKGDQKGCVLCGEIIEA
jgi:hypothetical protein